MPFNLSQWTGIAVATIVVSGSDTDVLYAVPLGILAGAVAMFFYSAAERYELLRESEKAPARVNRGRRS